MILVTGGSGFVGRHVVQALLAQNRAARVLDLLPWPAAPQSVEIMQASIRNETALKLALRGVTGVIHLAAITNLWRRNPRDFTTINAEGAKIIAQACAREGIKRFVYVSSHTTLIAGKPGLQEIHVNERNDPPIEALLGAYPRSKREGERLVMALSGAGTEMVCAIPTLPAGPGDISRTSPTKLLLSLSRGHLPAILEASMNFIDVRDLARSLIAALDHGRAGERYLLSGNDLLLSQVAQLMGAFTGHKGVLPHVPYRMALAAAGLEEALGALTGRMPNAPLTGVRLAGRQVSFVGSKAISELDHQCRPFAETLRDFLDWAEGLKPKKRPKQKALI